MNVFKKKVDLRGMCVCLMALVFSISHLSAAHSEEIVARVTELAIPARPQSELHSLSEHGFEPLRGEQKGLEREVMERVRAELTDYSKGTLRESVEHFLVQTLDFIPTSMQESISKRPRESTFIASDGHKELYIRVFGAERVDAGKTRASHFVRQLAGAKFYEELGLPQVVYLKHLAAGFCQDDTGYYYFVAGLNPPGKNLQQLHAEIFKTPRLSAERAHATEVFKRALARLGCALGAMHSKNAVAIKLTPEMLAAFQARIDRKLKAYAKAGGDRVENIRMVLSKQMAELSASNAYLTYHHGSANLKKFFYDEESDTLALKELYESHVSMGQDGQPLGLFAGHDVNSLLNDIVFERLHFEEGASNVTEELMRTFGMAYHHVAKDSFQPALIQLEQSFRILEKYTSSLTAKDDAYKQKCLKLCDQYFSREVRSSL